MSSTEVINVDKDGLSTRFWSNETKSFVIIPRGYFSVFKCHILVPMANVEGSCGPDECRACTAFYDKPPHYTPVYRGVAFRRRRVCSTLRLGILRLLIKLPRMTLFYLGAISVRRRKNQAVNQCGDGLCKYQDGSYKSCIFDSLGRDRGNLYWQIERA